MKKTTWFVLITVLILSLSLPACTRSASTAPAATATTAGNLPFPVPATSNAMEIILTQTAMAKTGPTQAPIIIPTSTPSEGGQVNTTPGAENPTVPSEPTATPAPTQPIPTFAPTAGLPTTYTLHEGEYPYCIARRYNIDPGALLSANNLGADSQPPAGTTLTIPSGAAAWNSGARARMEHPDNHLVVAGESIYSIACAYGDVDPNGIIEVNKLASPYTLTAGQTLQIP